MGQTVLNTTTPNNKTTGSSLTGVEFDNVINAVNAQTRTKWYNPYNYGAVGDGTTDDTSAFNAMIQDMPSRGAAIILESTDYRVDGPWVIDRPCLIMGSGSANRDTFNAEPIPVGGTRLISLSATANQVDMRASNIMLQNINFVNQASSNPTAGCSAWIEGTKTGQTAINYGPRFINCSWFGFYDNINAAATCEGYMIGCFILAPVRRGIWLRDFVNADAGDFMITNCQFISGKTANPNPSAAIYQESSGGLILRGNKFNALGTGFDNHLFCNINGQTGVLIVEGNSFENCNKSSLVVRIQGSGFFELMNISNNEFAIYSGVGGYAVDVDGVLNTMNAVAVENNIFKLTNPFAAIRLSYINSYRIDGNVLYYPSGGNAAPIQVINCTNGYCQPTLVNPTEYHKDTFVRTNATLNGANMDIVSTATVWTNQSSSAWAVSSNKAVNTDSNAGTLGQKIATFPTSLADGILKAVLFYSATRTGMGMVFRYADTSNYMYLFITQNGASAAISLAKKVSGTPTSLVTQSVTAIASDFHEIKIIMTGTHVQVLFDGNIVIDYTGTTTLESNTTHGIYAYKGTGDSSVDNGDSAFGPVSSYSNTPNNNF